MDTGYRRNIIELFLCIFLDHMRQVVFASDTASLDAGNILESARSDQDNIVLLQVVTFSWHIGCQLLARGYPH